MSQFLELGSGSQPLQPVPSAAIAPPLYTSAGQPPAAAQQSDILKQALDLALSSNLEPRLQGSHSRAVTSINEGLPALPTKLLQRIWANEYVDFSELPPAKSKPRALPHYLEGRVLLVQMEELDCGKKALPDFATWAQCFALYAAAVLLKQPERASDLMAYFYSTASNARKYKWPSWLVYDQNFRQLMADTRDNLWAKTNASIFAQCFLNAQKSSEGWCRSCLSVDHASHSCPIAPSTSSGRTRQESASNDGKRGICRDFNAKEKSCRWGANCYRKHICVDCLGAHPRFKCPRRKEDPTSGPNKN